ncbi:MAG: vanadium-dependent haloperoxidase [Gaiellaceae bacterium]
MRRKPQVAWAALAAVATLFAVLLVGAAAPAQAGPPEDAVLDWNQYAVEALVNVPNGPVPNAGQGPTVAMIHLAMVQGAVYDAVNMIDGGYEPYLDDLPSAPASASMPAAVATAAHHVLVGMVMVPPLATGIVDRLNGLYADSLAAIPNGAAKSAGIAAGEAAAAAMLAERANDGRYGPFRFTCGEDAGEWRPATSTVCTTPSGPSDPNAWVARVEPFVLESTSQFRTKGPHSLTSGAYAKEYEEVKSLGAPGSSRTPEQEALVRFFTNSTHPPEWYNRTFRVISDDAGLTLAEQARLFGMLNMAGADTLINCWDDKAFWSFWRPITAIRMGNDDGNPKTVGDPTWTSLEGNPPYPEHSSGYNCVTGAFMHTAGAFFGKKPMTFDLVRKVTGAADVTRTYNQFTDVVDDVIDARVYQGIHFRASDVQGAGIGRDVAHWLDKNFLQPVK